MSFDAFNTRVEFNGLLRKLNATLPSIQKVGAYAIRYGSRCGEDLWECIMQQSSQVCLLLQLHRLNALSEQAGYTRQRGHTGNRQIADGSRARSIPVSTSSTLSTLSLISR